MVKLNEYQTPIEDLNLHLCPEEVQEQFMEYLTSVPFIRNLTSPDRPRCKDLPRDEQGRAIIDITNPPILEDMDYFRPTALHWERDGTLTNLRPNPNPNSEFGKWMKREVDRIWNGMVRPSDGMWITGDDYFYLNYSLIELSEEVEGTDIADRIIAMPKVWEGVWWRHLYWYYSRQKALNAAEIAKRGASKSYSVASKLAKIFILGENFKSCKGIKGMVVAYAKEYLTKDGTLNKFEFMIDSLQELAPWWPNKTLQRSLSDMNWQMGYIDSVTGGKRGTKNLILGVAVKDDPDKPRGKRPHPYYCNVLTTQGIKKWGDIQVGDYVYGNNGVPTRVVDIPFEGEDDIYKITLRDGRITYAGKEHMFTVYMFSQGKEVKRTLTVEELIKGQSTYKQGYKYSIPRQDAVEFPEQQVFIDPYVLGLYLGDGCYNQCRTDKINLTMLREDFDDIAQHVSYKVTKSVDRDITHYIHLLGGETGDRNYQNFAASLLQYYGLGHKHAGDKFIPKQYLFNSECNRIKLLKGLLDTDGTCTTQGSIEYATKSKQLADDFMWLCRSLGINCSCYQKTSHRNDNVYYRVKLHTLNRELFNLKRKQDRVRITDSRYMHSFSEKTAIVSIDYVGKQPCKCITVDNESHLYLIDDFITTHNSVFIGAEEFGAFPKILDTYNVMLPSVREGGKAFGMMALIGTGGSEGNDFSGALEMIYKPKGYHILGLPNVWDKVNKGIGESIFFFPAYVNRAGCYDHNGNSDVTKALREILMDWYNAKYNTSDPMQVVRTKAENPITIQDAIMRRDNTVFPVADLIERIGELDANPNEFDDVYVGEMCLKSDGTAYYKPNRDKPLREFPHKGNKHEGAVEIFKMPEKNRDGRVFAGRYIAGLDPIDNDLARSTTSLISCFILDLWTDQMVAEWTGRLDMADDGYEICRRLAMFYNAKICYENNKKGLYSYFKTMNSLYLLAPNLEFLKDKDKVKGENYGNTAYGVNAGTFVNDFARERLNNWFRKPVKRIVIQDGNEVEITKMNLYYCRNRALLQEASQWNPDGNFDRVSACGMLMLYREECLIKCGGNPMETEKKKQSESQGEKDDYFDRNWHGKK